MGADQVAEIRPAIVEVFEGVDVGENWCATDTAARPSVATRTSQPMVTSHVAWVSTMSELSSTTRTRSGQFCAIALVGGRCEDSRWGKAVPGF